MKKFLSQGQDREFKDWLAEQPHGFYLNEQERGNIRRGVGNVILHSANCHHLGDGEGVISTTYAKVASDEREQLIEWAGRVALNVVPCKSCDPFGGTVLENSKQHSLVALTDPMARYPWGPPGTPHTDPNARVRSFRMVVSVRAVRVTGGFYRSAPADGTFELYDPALADPVEVKPSGKKEVQVICAWYGGRPNKKSGVHIDATSTHCRVEVLNSFTGRVVDDIGPVNNTSVSVDDASLFPDEVSDSEQFLEGATKRVTVNVYERNAAARNACIAHFGATCQVCSFDFTARYGELGNGFIHVHHIRPLSEICAGYVVDPKRDLVPVCPNCHAMLHQTSPPLRIEVLQSCLRPAEPVG